MQSLPYNWFFKKKPFRIKTNQVSIQQVRRITRTFSDWKRGIFHRGKKIEELRGGVHRYAAQAALKIDAATGEKNRFQMKTSLDAIQQVKRTTSKFSNWKRGIFHRGKKIEGLRGGVHRYAAQASLKIDAATGKKNRFQMKTSRLLGVQSSPPGGSCAEFFLRHCRGTHSAAAPCCGCPG